VPHRLPDGKIIAFLNKHNGEVLCTKRLKDRKGYFNGRRMYRMRTAELQRKPIPQLIRISDCSIKITITDNRHGVIFVKTLAT